MTVIVKKDIKIGHIRRRKRCERPPHSLLKVEERLMAFCIAYRFNYCSRAVVSKFICETKRNASDVCFYMCNTPQIMREATLLEKVDRLAQRVNAQLEETRYV